MIRLVNLLKGGLVYALTMLRQSSTRYLDIEPKSALELC